MPPKRTRSPDSNEEKTPKRIKTTYSEQITPEVEGSTITPSAPFKIIKRYENLQADLEREKLHSFPSVPSMKNVALIDDIFVRRLKYSAHIVDRLQKYLEYKVCNPFRLQYNINIYTTGEWKVKLFLIDLKGTVLQEAKILELKQTDTTSIPLLPSNWDTFTKLMSTYTSICDDSDKYRFVFVPLILNVYKQKGSKWEPPQSHANIILIDQDNNTIERFDPHGDIKSTFQTNLRTDILDTVLKRAFNINDYKVLNIRLQSGREPVKENEIEGYCNPWCMLYFQRRVEYPSRTPSEIESLINNDINEELERYMNFREEECKQHGNNYAKLKEQNRKTIENIKKLETQLKLQYSDKIKEKLNKLKTDYETVIVQLKEKKDIYNQCMKGLENKQEIINKNRLHYIRKYVQSTKEPFNLDCMKKLDFST